MYLEDEVLRVKEAKAALEAAVYYLDKEELYSKKADTVRSHTRYVVMNMEFLISQYFAYADRNSNHENDEPKILKLFEVELHSMFSKLQALLNFSGETTLDEHKVFSQVCMLHGIANEIVYVTLGRFKNSSVDSTSKAA